MHHDRPRRHRGVRNAVIAAALAAAMPASAATDTSPHYQKLSEDAKLVVETTNEAIGGEIGQVCESDIKAIHRKVFDVSNALQKAGRFKGQGYYGLEARTYYSQRCRDFK